MNMKEALIIEAQEEINALTEMVAKAKATGIISAALAKEIAESEDFLGTVHVANDINYVCDMKLVSTIAYEYQMVIGELLAA